MIQGYDERLEHKMQLAAWETAYNLNIWTKRTIKPSDLLKTNKTISAAAFDSAEEARAYMVRLKKKGK